MRFGLIVLTALYAAAVHAEDSGTRATQTPSRGAQTEAGKKSGYWSTEQMGARARARLREAAKAVDRALDEGKPAAKADARTKP